MEPFMVAGVRLGVARAGIKYPDRRDLVVIEVAAGTQAAAVFTQNAFCAAPVSVCGPQLAMVVVPCLSVTAMVPEPASRR